METKERFFKRYFVYYTVIIVGIFSFGAGFFIGAERVNQLSPEEAFPKLVETVEGKTDGDLDPAIFEMVWDRVGEKFVDQPVDQETLFYGALGGIVDGVGDPYSVFFPPERTATFKDELQGQFEGIGAEIGIKDEQLQVIAPLAGTPAAEAGLLPGDLILTIDGTESATLSLEEAVFMIRGEQGTEVTLLIFRADAGEPFEVKITREKIDVESVSFEVMEIGEKKIGYIKIVSFSDDTTSGFKKAVRELLVEDIDGVIVDLRNNPGGFLVSSVDIASAWIEDGTIVYEQYSDGSRIPHDSDGKVTLGHINTVVLLNEGSASASEILAGALQDHRKATIIGEQSFGKGSVQDFEEFRDGSSLKLTVARWLTPNGTLIEGQGITPDQIVEYTFEDFQNDLDPQLDAALDFFVEK